MHELRGNGALNTPAIQEHRHASLAGNGSCPGVHLLRYLSLQQDHACCLQELRMTAVLSPQMLSLSAYNLRVL